MRVKSVGFKNSGRVTTHTMNSGTISDLASELGVDASTVDWRVNNEAATPSTQLNNGDFVQYSMRNIKAA